MKKKAKIPVYLVPKYNSPALGMTRNTFYYPTEFDGEFWLATVDEEQLREPDTFTFDPDPCGLGFPTAAKRRWWLNRRDANKGAARVIGYIYGGKLYVTKRVRVETGWGCGFGGMICTSGDVIRPSAKIPAALKRRKKAHAA